ncbi:MAG: hypothetical protein Q4F35_06545, partial [Akkermansia sp.]|nr:hypothetical protein [Akkermansia sp.]
SADLTTGGLRKSLYSESLGFISTCVSQKKSLGHMWVLTQIKLKKLDNITICVHKEAAHAKSPEQTLND